MEIGDKVIPHISKSEHNEINGIYAWGTIISKPRIEKNIENYCYGKKTVDVKIEQFSYGKPLLDFEKYKNNITNFRGPHKISIYL